MANEKITMPSGMGGIVRYFDEYKSKIEISPVVVVVLIVITIVVELFLNLGF